MGSAGYLVNGLAVVLIVFFNIMFCFRKYSASHTDESTLYICTDFSSLAYAMPTSVPTMNYNSVILVGTFALTGVWWLIHGIREYAGPKLTGMYVDEVEYKP